MTLKDRLFRRSTADLMTGPGGILAAGGGAAVAIVTGLGPLAAVAAGAAAWAGRVGVGLARRPLVTEQPKLQRPTLREPWARYADEALASRDRFHETAEGAGGAAGERMSAMTERIDRGVEAIFSVAARAQVLEDARRQLDPTSALSDLESLRADSTAADRPAVRRTIESLEAQVSAAQRVDAELVDTADQLGLLDARLDEAVTRAVELSVQGSPDLAGLDREVDDMVLDMEALRQAIHAIEANQSRPSQG